MGLRILVQGYTLEGGVGSLAHRHGPAPHAFRMSCDTSSRLYLHIVSGHLHDGRDDARVHASGAHGHDGLERDIRITAGLEAHPSSCHVPFHLPHTEGPYMQGVPSTHTYQLGEHAHRDTVVRILRDGRMHCPVDMHRHFDPGVFGHGLKGTESAGQDVHHEFPRTPALHILRQLDDVVGVAADVDGVHHVPALLVHPVEGLGHGLGPLLYRAERLVDEGLVVLAVGESSDTCLVDVFRRILGGESDLGLHDGPDQRLLRT